MLPANATGLLHPRKPADDRELELKPASGGRWFLLHCSELQGSHLAEDSSLQLSAAVIILHSIFAAIHRPISRPPKINSHCFEPSAEPGSISPCQAYDTKLPSSCASPAFHCVPLLEVPLGGSHSFVLCIRHTWTFFVFVCSAGLRR